MKYILFTLIFSIFSLCAKNLQPLTHEEVKHFRVLNAQVIRAAKGASGYDAIGIFALCKQELEAQNSACICPLSGSRVEYFSRLSAAVSLGIGFDAGIINKPMNSTEAGVFKGMAKALGNQLQRAAAFVTLADVSSGFERTHLQGFDNAIKTGTMKGPHTIDLGQVAAEKANAPLRAKLAREYADLPRVNTYDQLFEVALLARVISSNPAYVYALQTFLNDTDLLMRPRISLVAKQFLGLLPSITFDAITPENLIICLGVLRNKYDQVPELFGALQLSSTYARERRTVFNTDTVIVLLDKLSKMRGRVLDALNSTADIFPRLNPLQLPDFAGYVASETNPARKLEFSGALLRALGADDYDQTIQAIKSLCSAQNLFKSVNVHFLSRFTTKAIEMVKNANPAEKQSIVAALQKFIVGYKILDVLFKHLPSGYFDPAEMLETQMKQFVGILRFSEGLTTPAKKQFKDNLSLLLSAPDEVDDEEGNPMPVDDRLAGDRLLRIKLVAALSRPTISRFPDALVTVINRIVESPNVRGFSVTSSKLNAIEALLSLGQDPTDVADMIMQVYSLPEESTGLEPVARLAERIYDRIIFNMSDFIDPAFREHSHLNFAIAQLNYPPRDQDTHLDEYITHQHEVLANAADDRRARLVAQGMQIAESAEVGQRVELRTTGCMAVHRIGTLICPPLERALDYILRGRRLVTTADAGATLNRWIHVYGSTAARAKELEDISSAKLRYEAIFTKAYRDDYPYRADFDRILPKVVTYFGGKSKEKIDEWLVNSLGEASQAYDGSSLVGALSCDKGIWERLLLGLKHQDQREFDDILAIIDLGDLVTNSFNTMQVLRSSGVNELGKKVIASRLWELWERKTPRTGAEAVRVWEEAIDEMSRITRTEVDVLLTASRYIGDARAPLQENFRQHVTGTVDRIKQGWKAGISGLFADFQRIKASRVKN